MTNLKLIEYFDAEEVKGFPEIFIASIESYIKLLELHKPKSLFRVANGKGGEFVFASGNVAFRFNAAGYKTVDDFHLASLNSFPSSEDFYEAASGGYTSYREFLESKKFGIDDKKIFLAASKAGFVKGFDDFISRYEKYKTASTTKEIPGDIDNAVKLYEYSKSKGFDNYRDFSSAYDKGFLDVNYYSEAKRKGFSDADEFFKAIRAGFGDAAEYREAKKLIIATKKEYKDYLYFMKAVDEEKCFDEFQMEEILEGLENGSTHSLEALREKLEEAQEKYKRAFENEPLKILPLWYKKKIDTEAKFIEFLKLPEIKKSKGFYCDELREFQIFRASKEKIYIDASNVAMNNSNAGNQKAKISNLKIVVDELLKKKYNDITIIADASLKHRAADYDLLKEFPETVHYHEVPAHTIADEFLIANAKNDKCKIVSNDTFSDWKVKDKWVAYFIDNIRMPFLITGGRVTFSSIESNA